VKARPHRINRVLPRSVDEGEREVTAPDAPRRLGSTLIDISDLGLPPDVSRALGSAFWNHVDVHSEPTLRGYWQAVRTFARFVAETGAITALSDIDSGAVGRYIEWLNRQVGHDGRPWGVATRSSAFYNLRTLL
jgi:hypothetical protein